MKKPYTPPAIKQVAITICPPVKAPKTGVTAQNRHNAHQTTKAGWYMGRMQRSLNDPDGTPLSMTGMKRKTVTPLCISCLGDWAVLNTKWCQKCWSGTIPDAFPKDMDNVGTVFQGPVPGEARDNNILKGREQAKLTRAAKATAAHMDKVARPGRVSLARDKREEWLASMGVVTEKK